MENNIPKITNGFTNSKGIYFDKVTYETILKNMSLYYRINPARLRCWLKI